MTVEVFRSKINRAIQRLILHRASLVSCPSLKALGFEQFEIPDASKRPILIFLRRIPPFPESFFVRIVPHSIFGRLNIEFGWFIGSIGYRAGFLHDESVPIWIWRGKPGWARALEPIMAQMLPRIVELSQEHFRDGQEKRELDAITQKPHCRPRSVVYEGDPISKLIAEFESELPVEIDDYFAEFLAELSAQSW
jgi:hypothetical protein